MKFKEGDKVMYKGRECKIDHFDGDVIFLETYYSNLGIGVKEEQLELIEEPQEECEPTNWDVPIIDKPNTLISEHIAVLRRDEKCLVWDHDGDDKEERIFIHKITGVFREYYCVANGSESEYSKGEMFGIVPWAFCEPLPKEVTQEEALEAWERVGGIEIQYPRNVKDMEEFIKVKDYITNN